MQQFFSSAITLPKPDMHTYFHNSPVHASPERIVIPPFPSATSLSANKKTIFEFLDMIEKYI